jgi:hypothetical protein
MCVCERELDNVERKSLHLVVYTKTLTIYLLVLLRLLEVDRVETLWNFEMLTQGLFRSHHGETTFGADFNHEKLMLILFCGVDALDLSHRKNHTVMSHNATVELETFLANSFDSIGTRERIWFNIYFRDDVTFVLFLKLIAKVRIDDGVDSLELYGGVAKIEL